MKKKLSTMIMACLLGASVAVGSYGNMAQAAPVSEDKVVVVTDDSGVFKVAKIRPERIMEEYRLFKNDTIELMALGQHDSAVDKEIRVGVDGMVQVPYAGNVKLVGLTLDEAKELIHKKLSRYFKIPEYYIILKSYGPRKVYVMGNVVEPGIKDMSVDNMNVYAAVSSAGGVDKRGRSKHVQILRQIDDTLYFREVNLDGFVKQHDMTQNIALEDGDIVYVPDSGKVVWSEDIAPYVSIYSVYRSITR